MKYMEMENQQGAQPEIPVAINVGEWKRLERLPNRTHIYRHFNITFVYKVMGDHFYVVVAHESALKFTLLQNHIDFG